MAEVKTIRAEKRTQTGTKIARRLRRSGRVPAIIYGHGQEPVPISIDRHELEVKLGHGQRLLSVELDGDIQSFLIKDFQYDHLGDEPLHLDLARVNLDEVVRVKVPVRLRGTPKSAAEGGFLEQLLSEMEVECRASDIPEEIKVAVAGLEVGGELTVGALELPQGVKALEAPDRLVAAIRVVAEEEGATEETEAETTEPEIIARGKAEEKEGSGES